MLQTVRRAAPAAHRVVASRAAAGIAASCHSAIAAPASAHAAAPFSSLTAAAAAVAAPARSAARFAASATPARGFASITLTDTSAGEFDAAHAHFLDVLQTLLESARFEPCNLDVVLSDGVLSVSSAAGTWVLNKHGPTRQLWLSSPVSGPRKYNFHREAEGANADVSGEGWLAERDTNDSLKARLIKEWSDAFGQPIDAAADFPSGE